MARRARRKPANFPGVYPDAKRPGEWWCNYKDPRTGKRNTRHGFTAELACYDWKCKVEDGELAPELEHALPKVAMTVAGFLPTFEAEHRLTGIDESTWREDYGTGIKRIERSPLGQQLLADVTEPAVESFLRWLREQDYKPATQRNTLVVLRLVFRYAIKQGYRSDNPVDPSAWPKKQRGLPVHLTAAEIPAFVAACGREYSPIAELMIATGIRISECCALRVRDLDFDAHVLHVTKQLGRDGKPKPTKGRAHRAIKLGDRQLVLLDAHLDSERWRRTGPDTHLFVRQSVRRRRADRVGLPYDRHQLRKLHVQACERFGRHLTPHALRHTAAIMWLTSGHSMYQVSRWLGHKSTATTEGWYEGIDETGDASRTEALIWGRRRGRRLRAVA